jgi:hypothetical protein
MKESYRGQRAMRVIHRLWPCLAGVLVAAPAAAVEPTGRGAAPARRPTLVVLTPGTQVPGPRPLPPGWTHLVIKSTPRLASGELDSLPRVAQSTAGLFRATILADVARSAGPGSPFELRRVGVGLCTPVRGVDTVVSTGALRPMHLGLGFVARKVLQEAEFELSRGRVKARTPSFVLYSAPSVCKGSRGHEAVLLRYALLVDPGTGALRTVLWSQASDPGVRTAPIEMALLPPGLMFDAALDVAAARVLNWSFAMNALPSGKRLQPGAPLRNWTLRDTLSPTESAALEAELSRLLAGALDQT